MAAFQSRPPFFLGQGVFDKFMRYRDHYLREVKAREGVDPKFVVAIVAHCGSKDMKEKPRSCKKNETRMVYHRRR